MEVQCSKLLVLTLKQNIPRTQTKQHATKQQLSKEEIKGAII